MENGFLLLLPPTARSWNRSVLLAFKYFRTYFRSHASVLCSLPIVPEFFMDFFHRLPLRGLSANCTGKKLTSFAFSSHNSQDWIYRKIPPRVICKRCAWKAAMTLRRIPCYANLIPMALSSLRSSRNEIQMTKSSVRDWHAARFSVMQIQWHKQLQLNSSCSLPPLSESPPGEWQS